MTMLNCKSYLSLKRVMTGRERCIRIRMQRKWRSLRAKSGTFWLSTSWESSSQTNSSSNLRAVWNPRAKAVNSLSNYRTWFRTKSSKLLQFSQSTLLKVLWWDRTMSITLIKKKNSPRKMSTLNREDSLKSHSLDSVKKCPKETPRM